MLLQNKKAIISGAAKGIGRAIAIELARQGADISFNFLTSDKEAKDLESEIKGLGVQCKAFQVDIKDFSAVESWVGQTRQFFGGLDIVVNNAGIIRDKALALMQLEDWHEVISTNLSGTFNLTRAAIVTLLKQKSGVVINVSSVSGIIGLERQTNYSASKGGIISFTRALAKEVAGYNIRVNAVAPGFIETEMLKGLKDDFKYKVAQRVPLRRLGSPDEVAKAVRFLATEAANYITGQTLIIDGGLSIA